MCLCLNRQDNEDSIVISDILEYLCNLKNVLNVKGGWLLLIIAYIMGNHLLEKRTSVWKGFRETLAQSFVRELSDSPLRLKAVAGLMTLSMIDKTWLLANVGYRKAVKFVNLCLKVSMDLIAVVYKVQKELLLMPYQVMKKLYEVTVKVPMLKLKKLYKFARTDRITAAEILTGKKEPSPEQIIEAVKEIRVSVIKTITSTKSSEEFKAYREKLDQWHKESLNRCEQRFKIGGEEKELMKSVALALRCMKKLKNKNNKMISEFDKNVSNLIEVPAKKQSCSGKNSVHQVLNNGRVVDLSEQCSEVLQNTSNLSFSFDALAEENFYLKRRLSQFHEILEEILQLSRSITQEVASLKDISANEKLGSEIESLHQELKREHELLKSAEADRDLMQAKLCALEEMIAEEEIFLGKSKLDFCTKDTDFSLVSASEEPSTS